VTARRPSWRVYGSVGAFGHFVFPGKEIKCSKAAFGAVFTSPSKLC